MRILFMGTPDFAKDSLEALVNAKYNVEAVVTNPDRPKGRGMKMMMSPVKEFALSSGIEKIYQPEKVKNNDQSRIILFIDEIYEIIKNDISVKDDINYLLEVGATMNIHIIMSTDSVLDEDINYLFDKDDISKLSFYLTTRREYNKFLDNYIDESLGRDGIYVSTNSKLTRISLPLIEDDEIARVVDNLKVNI